LYHDLRRIVSLGQNGETNDLGSMVAEALLLAVHDGLKQHCLSSGKRPAMAVQ